MMPYLRLQVLYFELKSKSRFEFPVLSLKKWIINWIFCISNELKKNTYRVPIETVQALTCLAKQQNDW